MECGPGTGASHLMDGTSASGHRRYPQGQGKVPAAPL